MVERLIKALTALSWAISLLLATSAYSYDFTVPYSHYSEREDLRALLVDFARSQGLSAQVSPELSGVISGRFEAVDPNTFLGGLYQAYGVRSYVLGDAIYFYSESEHTQSLFKPSALSAPALRKALSDAHLSSPDLPLRVNPQGLLVVAGPASYVTNLITVAQEFDAAPEHEIVMKVFKLKHAKAQDITVNSMDSQVVIPGIASILQRMVGGTAYEGSGTLTVTTKSARQETLRGLGLAANPEQNAAPSVSATVTAMTGLENTSWQKLENDTSIFYPSFSLFGKILVRSKMTGRKQFHSQRSKLLRLVCFPPVISSVYNDLTRI